MSQSGSDSDQVSSHGEDENRKRKRSPSPPDITLEALERIASTPRLPNEQAVTPPLPVLSVEGTNGLHGYATLELPLGVMEDLPMSALDYYPIEPSFFIGDYTPERTTVCGTFSDGYQRNYNGGENYFPVTTRRSCTICHNYQECSESPLICDIMEAKYVRDFYAGLEIDDGGASAAEMSKISLPFCQPCRDKVVMLSTYYTELQNFKRKFEGVRNDLAFTTIESLQSQESDPVRRTAGPTGDIRAKIMARWMQMYEIERTKAARQTLALSRVKE